MEEFDLGRVHGERGEDAPASTVGVELGGDDRRCAANRIMLAELSLEAIGETVARRVRGETGGDPSRKRQG